MLSPQEVTGIRAEGPYRILTLADGSEINCHALLIACGVSYNVLDVPNASELSGAGVYYGAALTEAMLYKDQEVMLVGAGNSAGQAAMYFAKYASKVTMLIRGSSLAASMSQYLIDQIDATENIELRFRVQVVEVQGDKHLEQVVLEDRNTGEHEALHSNALFIFFGAKPYTDWVGDAIARDRLGYVLTGPDIYVNGRLPRSWRVDREPFLLESSMPGVFVAGDARHGSVKRVASAVGEGSIAIQFVHRYLATL
jgi:thioredoxin reductase (NADPH)